MATIEQFSIGPGSGEDATPAVRDALEVCRDRNDRCLIFPPGRYDFWPDKATERYLFISNNTEGLKRIAFPLFDLDSFKIDGQEAEFVFHGSILPFAVLGGADIRLAGFSIDWERPFHSEGRISEIGDGWLDLDFSEEFPYKIQGNRLVFTGEGGEDYRFSNLLEFDPDRRETAFRAHDNYGIENRHEAREIQPGRVRLAMALASPPTLGNTLVFGSDHRKYPGIFISGSRHVEIEDVTLHHSGGMGIIAQKTADAAVRRVRVTPPPGKGRLTSLTADATHFVGCRGRVEITDCLFENQMDDPVNVHGIYARISARLSAHTLEVALMHGEQQGIDLFAPGDTAELVTSEALNTYHAGTVKSVRRLNKAVSILTFAEGLPVQIKVGDVAVCREANPDVTIRGCTSRGNRARGFLISTGGHVLIEDNYFHTPGAAILIAGDANYWFESGPVQDVTIRANHFDNCLYGVWGNACIDICPEIALAHRAGTVYHRHIRVEGNTFDAFDPRLVRAYCVDGLTVAGNDIRLSSTDYPQPGVGGEAFDITDSASVVLQDV